MSKQTSQIPLKYVHCNDGHPFVWKKKNKAAICKKVEITILYVGLGSTSLTRPKR